MFELNRLYNTDCMEAMQKIPELIQAAANKEYRLVRGRTKGQSCTGEDGLAILMS